MVSLFISHSSHDTTVATTLTSALKTRGYETLFLDVDPEAGIDAGADWEQAILRNLEPARAMLALYSESSMLSRWCFAEIVSAKLAGKSIFPIRLDDCKVDSIIERAQIIDWRLDDAFERLCRGLARAGIDPHDDFGWNSARAPYPGLHAFEAEDAAIYFGRQPDIDRALDTLRRMHLEVQAGGATRTALLVGDSGCGKSSLVRAGILPRLRKDAATWVCIPPFRPGDRPIDEAAAALLRLPPEALAAANLAHRDHRSLAAELESDGALESSGAETALARITQAISRWAGERAVCVLTIDQWEELFGPTPAAQTDAFVRMIARSLASAGRALVLVGTIRSDFLGAFQKNATLRDLPYETIVIGPPEIKFFPEIIERPAKLAGITCDHELVMRMAADTGSEDGLPLLSYALRTLYDQPGGNDRFTVAAYERIGGIAGSVAHIADRLTEGLDDATERALHRAFLRLARMTDSGSFVRRSALWDEMPPAAHGVLERFGRQRLLVFKAQGEKRSIEVVHESLFRVWPRLAGWLQAGRDFLAWRKSTTDDVDAWEANGRLDTFLLTGHRLAAAQRWLDDPTADLEDRERAFIETGRAVAEREQTKRAERDASDRQTVDLSLENGDYARAAAALEALAHAAGDDGTPEAIDVREKSRRIARIVTFTSRANEVYEFAGEEEFAKAGTSCESALDALGVFVHPTWWERMPIGDLTAEQAGRIKAEAYRQLLLLGALRSQPAISMLGAGSGKPKAAVDISAVARHAPAFVMQAFVDFGGLERTLRRQGNREAARALVEAFAVLRRIRVFERAQAAERGERFEPSRMSRFLWRICRMLYVYVAGPSGTPIDARAMLARAKTKDETGAAWNPADYYFIGLFNYYVARRGESLLSKIITLFPGLFPDLDGKAPYDTAERLLRTATYLEPQNFWPHFVLGRVLLSRGDFASAELAFNTCVSLKPDYARGFEQRSLAVCGQWAGLKSDDLRRRARADSDRALALSRGDPSTFWPRGELFERFGAHREALDAYARALELEENIMEKLSRGTEVSRVFAYASDLVRSTGGASDETSRAIVAAARAVIALVHYLRKNRAAAVTSAEAALADDPGQLQARTVLAMLLADDGKAHAAVAAFDGVLARDPNNYLAALRRARVLDAPEAWQRLSGASDPQNPPPAWMRREADAASAQTAVARGR